MHGPLQNLEQWDDFVASRYEEGKTAEQFRNYDDNTPPVVREFYRLNHTNQTLDFVLDKKKEYLGLRKRRMSTWEALEYLNTLVDDSDPDTDLSQIEHNLQAAEAIRRDGHPRWFQLTGLIHDLGKVLVLYGEPQWAVVGDTFPVGCAYSDKIVYPQFFAANPDSKVPELQTQNGIYKQHAGLEGVHLSWGHDEYLYHIVKDYLPMEALYMIRYHSFYSAHREGAYAHLMNQQDREMFEWVKKFNPYDLYSKSDTKPSVAELRPYYEELIREYLPEQLTF